MAKFGVFIFGFSDFVGIRVDLFQEFKHICDIQEWVVRVGTPSSMQMISGFSFGPSEDIEHAIFLGFPPIAVSIHLAIHEVLPLLVCGVLAIAELIGILKLASGAGSATSGVVSA